MPMSPVVYEQLKSPQATHLCLSLRINATSVIKAFNSSWLDPTASAFKLFTATICEHDQEAIKTADER